MATNLYLRINQPIFFVVHDNATDAFKPHFIIDCSCLATEKITVLFDEPEVVFISILRELWSLFCIRFVTNRVLVVVEGSRNLH